MITVAILINGKTVMARSAWRLTWKTPEGLANYHCDTGDIIEHHPDDGVVALAHKLLDTIKDVSK